MPTSFGIGLAKKEPLAGSHLIVDIDDWELGFFYHSGFFGRVGRFLNFSNPNGLPYVWRMEHLVGHADAISVSNRFLQKKFGGKLLPHYRDTKILNPLKFNADDVKEEMGLIGKKILMFLGTPRSHKGIDDLLDAFKKIDNPDLNLVIIGVENKQEFLKGIDVSVKDRVTVMSKRLLINLRKTYQQQIL